MQRLVLLVTVSFQGDVTWADCQATLHVTPVSEFLYLPQSESLAVSPFSPYCTLTPKCIFRDFSLQLYENASRIFMEMDRNFLLLDKKTLTLFCSQQSLCPHLTSE